MPGVHAVITHEDVPGAKTYGLEFADQPVLASDRVPMRGDQIFSNEQEIGRVTSAARSPAMNAAVAIGYVRRDHASEGTELSVRSGGQDLHARVHQIRN